MYTEKRRQIRVRNKMKSKKWKVKHPNWPLKKDINKKKRILIKTTGRNKFLINQDGKVSKVDNHLQYYWKIWNKQFRRLLMNYSVFWLTGNSIWRWQYSLTEADEKKKSLKVVSCKVGDIIIWRYQRRLQFDFSPVHLFIRQQANRFASPE